MSRGGRRSVGVKKYRVEQIIIALVLLLVGCSSTPKSPHVSGIVWACNNPNCGKALHARIRVTFLPQEKGQINGLQNTLVGWEGPTTLLDSAKHKVCSWLIDQIRDSAKDPNTYYWGPDIIVDAPLSLDRSLLCDNCKSLYAVHNIPLNTPGEQVNLRKAGFRTERDVMNAVARSFGFKNFEDITPKYRYDKCFRSACESASRGITLNGWDLETTIRMANMDVSWCQERIKKESLLSKDPDQMTDQEWYDYMEQMSKDPTWKQVVRDQRKAKGID